MLRTALESWKADICTVLAGKQIWKKTQCTFQNCYKNTMIILSLTIQMTYANHLTFYSLTKNHNTSDQVLTLKTLSREPQQWFVLKTVHIGI